MRRVDRSGSVVLLIAMLLAPSIAVEAAPVLSGTSAEITSPADRTPVATNAIVGYAAAVTHDGKSSAFEELPANSVVVEARVVPDVAAAAALPRTLPPALSAMAQSNCAGCHDFSASGAGPSFEAIARRYAGQPGAAAALADHIRQGSHGRWGAAAMPPHGDLSQTDARSIADWIVAHGADPAVRYAIGPHGSFRMTAPPRPGPAAGMVLTAYYAGPADAAEARSAGPRSRVVLLAAVGR